MGGGQMANVTHYYQHPKPAALGPTPSPAIPPTDCILPAAVPMAAAIASISGSLYTTMALASSSRAAAGSRTPTKGSALLSSRPARTPPHAARARALAGSFVAPLTDGGGGSGGGGGVALHGTLGEGVGRAAPDARSLQLFVMPAAQLIGAAALAALQVATRSFALVSGGGSSSEGGAGGIGGGAAAGGAGEPAAAAIGTAEEGLEAAAKLCSCIQHPEVVRRVLDGWMPLSKACLEVVERAASDVSQGQQNRHHQHQQQQQHGSVREITGGHAGDRHGSITVAALASEATRKLEEAAAGFWCKTMGHWTALPVNGDNAPHLQG